MILFNEYSLFWSSSQLVNPWLNFFLLYLGAEGSEQVDFMGAWYLARVNPRQMTKAIQNKER